MLRSLLRLGSDTLAITSFQSAYFAPEGTCKNAHSVPPLSRPNRQESNDVKEKRLKISAYGLCLDGDHILLALYHDPNTHQEWWTLPGGKIVHGEDPVDAVQREYHEETGYHASAKALLGVGSRTHNVDWGIPGGAELHVIAMFYEMDITGGTLTDEIAGSTVKAQWFPLGEVKNLDRAVIVDQGIALNSERPAHGQPTPVAAQGKIRN